MSCVSHQMPKGSELYFSMLGGWSNAYNMPKAASKTSVQPVSMVDLVRTPQTRNLFRSTYRYYQSILGIAIRLLSKYSVEDLHRRNGCISFNAINHEYRREK